ncbi:hypothetical protein GZH53_14780 [Flavihumibacter sp. R14]|nr:hypothetical protein [Flavihumibacter soli]
MNKLYSFIILLLFVITFGSCKKARLEKMEQSLVGSWELREISGGEIFGISSHYAAGNGNIMQFTERNVTHILANKIATSGSYTVDVRGSGRDREYIINYRDLGTQTFFKIEDNKLTMYSDPELQGELQDATPAIYERVKDPVLERN